MGIKRKISCKSLLKAFEAIIHLYCRFLCWLETHVNAAFSASDTGDGIRLHLKKKKSEAVVTLVAEKVEATGVNNS